MKVIKKTKTLNYVLIGLIVGGLIGYFVNTFFDSDIDNLTINEKQNLYFASSSDNLNTTTKSLQFQGVPNFADVAEKITPAIVQIITTDNDSGRNGNTRNQYFRDFFDDGKPHPRQFGGSGVILTPDGYIATNNHVIEGGDKIEVVLSDKRRLEAEVVGTDPNTDISLLKVEADDLPIVPIGSSDELRVGEWVLAVGNPFNLYSTVTAGIVSAKARNIGLLSRRRNNYAIESFIQTDAAINRGNSGGALVNSKGELVGICTAIASRSGSYEGYGFAVPIDLAKKIMEDFKKYGKVRRGFLGVSITDVNNEIIKRYDLEVSQGVYISSIIKGSAAEKANLREGDVIVEIESKRVNTVSEMMEKIGSRSPGEKVRLTYVRGGDKKQVTIELKGEDELKQITAKANLGIVDKLGIELEPISVEDIHRYGLSNGVRIKSIERGKSFDKNSGFQTGAIIIKVNDYPVNSIQDVAQALSARSDGFVTILGIDEGQRGTYFRTTFPLD